MKRDTAIILGIELGMFAISLISFWFFTSGADAMGYALLYVWGLMPLVSCATSFVVGLRRTWDARGVLWPVLCTVLITLLPIATFDAFYAFHTGRLPVFDFAMLIWGCIVSYAGFGLGVVVRLLRKRIRR